MTAQIIKIGNSRGLRIPKKVLDQYQMDGRVELILTEEGIVLKPIASPPRAGWAQAFARMATEGDDALLIGDVFGDEDFDL